LPGDVVEQNAVAEAFGEAGKLDHCLIMGAPPPNPRLAHSRDSPSETHFGKSRVVREARALTARSLLVPGGRQLLGYFRTKLTTTVITTSTGTPFRVVGE
jgi:hypothetical protein